MDPSKLNARSRYDLLPSPTPHFPDPNYYPPPPLPLPPQLHRYQYHPDFDRRPPADPRLFFPYPHPPFPPGPSFNLPLPIARVPDRLLLHPDAHPSPYSRRPRHAEPSPPEFWDDADVFEDSNERPCRLRSEWELPNPPEDPLGSPVMGKKRYRIEQGRGFEERRTGRRVQRRMDGFLDGQGDNPEAPFSTSAPSPRGPSHLDTETFEKSSAQEDHDCKENSAGNRRKRSLSGGYTQDCACSPAQPKPSALSRIRSGKSVWERIEERPAFLSSSSSPRLSPTIARLSVPEEHHELDMSYKSKASLAKVLNPSFPSAAAPTSSEKGHTVEAAPKKKVIKKAAKTRSRVVVQIVAGTDAPGLKEVPPKAPLSDYTHQASDYVKQSTDPIVSSSKRVSDASNPKSSPKRIGKTASPARRPAKRPAKALGFKESSVTKDIKGEAKAADTEEEAGKYVNVTSTKVTATDHSTSSLSKNPHQASDRVQASPNLDISSSKRVTDAGFPQFSPKRIAKTALPGKRPAKRQGKTFGFKESSVTKEIKGEGKAAHTEDEAEKSANVITTVVSATDHSTSQPCHQDATMATTSFRECAAEQSARAENPIGSIISEIGEEECTARGEVGENCAYPIVSDVGIVNSASPLVCAQESTINMKSPGNKAATESSISLVLVDNELAEDTMKQAQQTKEDIISSTYSDIESSVPSNEGYSGSELWNDARVMLSLGPYGNGNSLKGQSIKRKREGEEDQKQLEVGTVNNNILGGRKSEYDDSCLYSHLNYRLSVLPSEVRDIDLNRTLPDGILYNGDHDICLPDRSCPLESDCMSAGQDLFSIPKSDPMEERMEQLLTSRQSRVDSLVLMSKGQDTGCLKDAEHSYSQSGCKELNSVHRNDNKEEKPTNRDGPSLSLEIISDCKDVEDVPSDKTVTLHCSIPGAAQPLSLHQPKRQVAGDQKVAGEGSTSQKTNPCSGVPRVVTNQVRLSASTKGPACSSHSARHKTWHRTSVSPASASHGNTERPGGSSMHKQSPKKLSRPQSSYIRKGNSLIRKLPTKLHLPTQSHNLVASSKKSGGTTRRSIGAEVTVDRTNNVTLANLPIERPKTPPLPLAAKLPNYIINPQRDFTNCMSEFPMSEANKETQIRQLEGQTVDLPSGSMDNQCIAICRKSETVKTKSMVYVKHKSNQLVAAPRPESSDSSILSSGTSQSLSSLISSDIYYRLKKNQLVRNGSSDFQQKQDKISDNSTLDEQRTSMVSPMKNSTTGLFKRRLDKAIQKSYKHPKFSLVWTLSGEKPYKNSVTSLDRWKVLPHLFPWKRTMYGKNFTSMSDKYSLPLISQKLQLTRKRNTIYKMSTDGFTLRKAGVFSIGGSSLKWSKSIERHSKKANEEATRAVAEADKKRRERKKGTFGGTKGKTGKFFPRERIFRVGSARYKMDSSRRTLIRIPDEQTSSVMDQQSGNKSQKSFVPRRLLIGNDEYIRVGNGNQLVRDPKKRIRILASEKVRWSLHTARLRLSRKKQYCQFFTRFGKCIKSEGKCPYIHDPTKVAICTKFLRGLCSDTNCKLTHKVLPERMPDCSYFLLGLCTNLNCPYRHVNVNPRASVCEGFLRGYCADGDECHKKHSYVCPDYEAMGKCLQGSECKLHHPKRRNKSKKRKQPIVQSNSRGRYFGSDLTEVVEPLIVSSDMHDEESAELFSRDGRFAGIECGGIETNLPMNSQSTPGNSGISDMQEDDLDALIKPVRIMKRAHLTNASANL